MNISFNNKNSPIIIAGMHRSGTSLLSKKLSEMNVFMGYYQDINNESLFFQRLNRWMMSYLQSSWDNPKSFYDINSIDSDYIESHIVSMLESKMFNFIYFGFYKKFILSHNFSKINYLWGWKDPSNTFTLPIWRTIFPKCKVIYILRHPADVAISLLNRNENINSGKIPSNKSKIASKYLSLMSFSNSDNSYSNNLNNLNDCIKLYSIYYDEIIKYKNDKILFIKFEELLSNPTKIFKNICDFINIEFKIMKIDELSKNFNSDRAYAHLKSNLDNKLDIILKSKITKHLYDEK